MKTQFITRAVEFRPLTYEQDLWFFHEARLCVWEENTLRKGRQP